MTWPEAFAIVGLAFAIVSPVIAAVRLGRKQ